MAKINILADVTLPVIEGPAGAILVWDDGRMEWRSSRTVVMGDEELLKEFREIYDRWCWDTGSVKDKNYLDEIEIEIKKRKLDP